MNHPIFEKILHNKMLTYIPMLVLGIVFIAIGVWFLSMVIPGIFSLVFGVYLTLRGNTKSLYGKVLKPLYGRLSGRIKRFFR